MDKHPIEKVGTLSQRHAFSEGYKRGLTDGLERIISESWIGGAGAIHAATRLLAHVREHGKLPEEEAQ